MEQFVPGMFCVEQGSKFLTQHVHLLVTEESDARDVAFSLVEVQLLFAERVLPPLIGRAGNANTWT